MTNIEMDACRAIIGINKYLATMCKQQEELLKQNATLIEFTKRQYTQVSVEMVGNTSNAFCEVCTSTCKNDPECEILKSFLAECKVKQS